MEKFFDIDRLHGPEPQGKGSGRTFRMLVDAVHHADFMAEDGTVHVLVHSLDFANTILKEMEWIAQQMEFEKIKIKGDKRIDINGIMFVVHKSDDPTLWLQNQSNQSVTFVDHFALGEQ